MYSMKQACQATGMSYEGLKYYCNQGLVPGVKRDAAGRRVFDQADIDWLRGLLCLKKCAMSMEEMKEYLALCRQGSATIPQRKAILARKRQALEARMAELRETIAFLDWKQGYYDELLAGRQPETETFR